MQANTRTAVSNRTLMAAASAMLVASVLAINGLPRAAFAAPAVDAAAGFGAHTITVHDSVDWSQVARTPVDTGATVGAYER